ncbi:MAG: histidine kinase, partial [Marinoscillum sp.]
SVAEDDQDYMVPSASLQLLVENTLKHNVITRENPLQVDVFVEDDWLYVRNNFQPKNSRHDSTGIGQKNLLKRLSYLSLPDPEFYRDGDFYVSKIPLLKDKA